MMKESKKKRLNLLSSTLFKIGNVVNLSDILRPQSFHKYEYIKDDKEALKSDWEAVGKNMKIAFDKLNNQRRM